ncbi:MAG: serine hydrolase [Cyanobacteria bacterium J06598_1]
MFRDYKVLSYLSRLLKTATAYKAKLLCSGVFVSRRTEAALLKEDLAVDGLLPLRLLTSQVDRQNKTVKVSCLGKFESVALYRPGLGSTLVLGRSVDEVRSQSSHTEKSQPVSSQNQSLPAAKEIPPEIDAVRLTKAVEGAFVEDSRAFFKEGAARTRAVVVVHKGVVIAEQYAPGFSAQIPLAGWSMAKSVVNALVGILVQQGKLSLDSQDLFPAWRNDSRREITVGHLLRMSSGLTFSEEYGNPFSDVLTMLFQVGDSASYAAQRPLQTVPGDTFSYAGGSTVLLCQLIREAVGGELADHFSFPRRALFDRIGMTSAVLESDTAGTFLGSSFMYATARDWAKFGLLYLQDGCWDCEGAWQRILPEGWVAYSTAPSAAADFYGAHFWRGVPNSFTDRGRNGDGGWPQDAYLAAGFQGQFVTVVPSCELVVVRLGLSQRRNSWDQVRFIEEMVAAVKG